LRDRMAGPETGLFLLHNAQHIALAYEGGGLLDGPSLFSVNGRCIRLPLPGTSDTQRLIYATIRSTAQRKFTDNDCIMNGATVHFTYQIRIHSARGGQGRDRMRTPSVTDAFRFTYGQTDSCTGSDVADMAVYGIRVFRPSYGREAQAGEAVSDGRRQSAQTFWQQDDAQVATGPHNQLPWRIWRAAEALPSRQWSFSWFFLLTGLPPRENNQHRHDLHAYLSEAQPRTQRIWHWHWSRGTVRTTYRHFNALHASLPGNHGYAAVRHGWGTTAHRWSAAELMLRGSVFYGMTYQAWTRNTRTGLSQQQRFPLSVGYHAREPYRL
jgi:hypothetical protein